MAKKTKLANVVKRDVFNGECFHDDTAQSMADLIKHYCDEHSIDESTLLLFTADVAQIVRREYGE